MTSGPGRAVHFVAGGGRYAVSFRWVSELVEEPEIVPLPEPGRAVALARVRGSWVPIVPVGGQAGPPPTGAGAVIVLGTGRARFGIWAEEVRGWVEEGPRSHAPAGAGAPAAAMGTTPDGVASWIDPAELLGGRAELLESGGEPMTEGTAAPAIAHIVEFEIGEDGFGIDVAKVYEVIRYPEVRALPQTPEFLEGAADLRGTVLPVVDLRKRFGLTPGPPGPETRVVVTDLAGERVGLVVDRVRGVRRVAAERLQPPPKFFKGLAARYLRAWIAERGGGLVVLDTDAILTSRERIQLRGATRGGSRAAREGGEHGE